MVEKTLNGGNIQKDDIMYEDNLVCILKPDVKKGILIFSNYEKPNNIKNLREIGLKTAKKLREDNISFNRNLDVVHPYIFFRAPFYSPKTINYDSPENEFLQLYNFDIGDNMVVIRVDPDKTFVFSSEIRVEKPFDRDVQNELNMSKKTLTEFLNIIKKNNEKQEANLTDQKMIQAYNLYTSELNYLPIINYPFSISNTCEILVQIDHLTPNYFVLCT